jgi:hypothetical protein
MWRRLGFDGFWWSGFGLGFENACLSTLREAPGAQIDGFWPGRVVQVVAVVHWPSTNDTPSVARRAQLIAAARV